MQMPEPGVGLSDESTRFFFFLSLPAILSGSFDFGRRLTFIPPNIRCPSPHFLHLPIMLLHIETVKREKYTHDFLHTATVSDIKKHVQDMWKLGTVDSQKLIYSGSILSDDAASIQSLSIKDGSTLVLFVRAPKPTIVNNTSAMQQQAQSQVQSATPMNTSQSTTTSSNQTQSPSKSSEQNVTEIAINQLVAMGFDRITSAAVLEATHGDVTAATGILLGESNTPSPHRRRRRRAVPIRASAAAANVMIDNVSAARNSANPIENLSNMSGVAPEVLAQLREIIQNDPSLIERTLQNHMSSDPTNFNRLRSNPLAIALLQAGLNVEAGGDAVAQALAESEVQNANEEDEHDDDDYEDPEHEHGNPSGNQVVNNEDEEEDDEDYEDNEEGENGQPDASIFTSENEAVEAVRALGMQMPEDEIREAYRLVGPRVNDIVNTLMENRDRNTMRDD
jgi:hypothetical protein